jgi:hypothetical protein
MQEVKKYALIGFGSVNVVLGVVGIFVPLMPTTVFLLIAASCFVRSSDQLYNRLISHPKLGSFVKNYREHRAMPKSAKIKAIVTLVISLVFSGLMVQNQVVWGILLIVFIVVSSIIFSIKTLEDLDVSETG